MKYDNSKGLLLIKINTPTIILPNQFQVKFDMLADTISFIKPGSPYDTTDKYYKATLAFETDSQNISTYNVKHDGDYLYNIINTLQTEVDKQTELKTQIDELKAENLTYTRTNIGTLNDTQKFNLAEILNWMDKTIARLVWHLV
jgi:hypothetical protein